MSIHRLIDETPWHRRLLVRLHCVALAIALTNGSERGCTGLSAHHETALTILQMVSASCLCLALVFRRQVSLVQRYWGA